MKYTADQLVALVEEARGYVHDAAMGAIWTKERRNTLINFMERTDVVEYNADGGYTLEKSLEPLKRKVKVGKNSIVVRNKDETETALSRVNVDKILKHVKTKVEKLFPKSEDQVRKDRVARDIIEVQPMKPGPYFLNYVKKLAEKSRANVGKMTITPKAKAEMIVVSPELYDQINKDNARIAKERKELDGMVIKDLVRVSKAMAKADKDVFKNNPRETAQDLIILGHKGRLGSIDDEAAYLKKQGVKGSRDFLREVVKLIRENKGNKS
jgi:hypothetical protein